MILELGSGWDDDRQRLNLALVHGAVLVQDALDIIISVQNTTGVECVDVVRGLMDYIEGLYLMAVDGPAGGGVDDEI